jgi:hypothetical protein
MESPGLSSRRKAAFSSLTPLMQSTMVSPTRAEKIRRKWNREKQAAEASSGSDNSAPRWESM